MLVVENFNNFLFKFSNSHGLMCFKRPEVTGKKGFSHVRLQVVKETEAGHIRYSHIFSTFKRRGSKMN